MSRLRTIRRALTLERMLPLAIIAGALVLIGSEFTETFRLEAAGDDVLDTFPGHERHAWTVLILGLCAIAATVISIVTGSRAAAVAVAVFGAACLLIFLLIDVPDAGRTDNYSYPGRAALEVAEAAPAAGFWLLLIGSLVVAVCGAALATLSSAQLRGLRPGAKPVPVQRSDQGEDQDERRPVPPWGRRRAKDEESDNGEKKRGRVRPKA